MISSPADVLQSVFGLAAFRPGQAAVVDAQLEGRDVLSVAPTGSGKSISYWVPALARPGLTLVVSPLIALMKDQVDRLRSLGVPAAFINSSLPRDMQERTLEEAEEGGVRLLYLAPERFSRPGFVERLGRLGVTRFVVDEAHCISSWGHDFRPDYRLLGRALAAAGRPPVAAFTATATPQVREDIARNLSLRTPFISVTGFNRPNLRLSAVRCVGDRGKRETLRRLLDPGAGRALVYTGTVAASEELAGLISSWGKPAAAYNGRLPDDVRRRVQEDFSAGRVRIVVATSAFGMGVDLPDIRQVFHYHLPGSLEAYYQEAGRAGRDGEPAACWLLFSPADRDLQSFFIEQNHGEVDGELKRHAYARLEQVMSYARLRSCRHARIADYFGEEGVARTCAACDNCLSPASGELRQVAAGDVRSALAAAARFSGRVGAANVAAVLAGRQTKWTKAQPWVEQLGAYGALRGWRDEALRDLLREMIESGLLAQSSGEYPVLAITDTGRDVLAGRVEPEVRLPAARAGNAGGPAGSGAPADPGLLGALKAWRAETARAANVPAYVIFWDRHLEAIAAQRPSSLAELAGVPGLGPAKLDRYGSELLGIIASC